MSTLKSKTGLDKNAPPLLRSDSKAVIHAPVDKIDIPKWLFTLTDEEYQQCSIAHIAGAATRSPDGKRMSINVEMAGSALMVQHWTEEIADKQHCRLVSLSDLFDQQARTKVQLAWDMTVKSLSESSCEFTNSLFVFGNDEFLASVEKSDASPEQVKDALQRTLDAHNAEETPNFAKSIEKKALIGQPDENLTTIKLIAVYDQPDDAAAFFKHYKEVHTPLVKKTPGLQRLVFNRILGDALDGSAPYAGIAEMDYPDREIFDAAMKSPQNQAVAKDLMSFAKGKVKVLIAESDN